MGTVSYAIESYIREVISIPRSDTSTAVRSRSWLIDRIRDATSGTTNGPQLYAEEPAFVYGSYLKGTQVAAVDEFDVMLVFDSNTGSFTVGDQRIGVGLGNAQPNHKYSPALAKSDGKGVSPKKLLAYTRNIVTSVVQTFGGETPQRTDQSVAAVIKSHDLTIELVPSAVFRRISDGEIFYIIPTGGGTDDWIVTAPRVDSERLDAAARNRENFRNVIRILKRINQTYQFGLKSFAIETATVDCTAYAPWHNDLHHDTAMALTNLAAMIRSQRIPDPLTPSLNLIRTFAYTLQHAARLDAIATALREFARTSNQDWLNERVRSLFENHAGA